MKVCWTNGVEARACVGSGLDVWLFVKNQVQQRLVNLDMAVVADETQLAEPIHEEAHARPGGFYHFGEGFLADLG